MTGYSVDSLDSWLINFWTRIALITRIDLMTGYSVDSLDSWLIIFEHELNELHECWMTGYSVDSLDSWLINFFERAPIGYWTRL